MTNRTSFLRCLLFATGVLTLLASPGAVQAHSPHHVITEVAVAPLASGDRDVFILVSDQVFRSNGEGAEWKNLVNGLNNQYAFTSVVVSPDYENDRTVFVSTSGDGVYRSMDGGESWESISAGLDRLDISTLSISPDYAQDNRILAASDSGGVWRSVDGAWRMVLTERVQVNGFAEIDEQVGGSSVLAGDADGGVWRSTNNGLLWEHRADIPDAGPVTSIAANHSGVFVGTTNGRLYRSTDAGKRFAAIGVVAPLRRRDCRGNRLESPTIDAHITSVTLSSGALASPRVLVTTWYGGAFVSSDHGDTWARWGSGLSCDQQADGMQVAHFRQVVIDEHDDADTVYWLASFDGLFRGVGDSPSWEQLETLPVGLIKGMAVSGGGDTLAVALATYGGGFYLTEDRGATWTIGNKGLRTTRLTGLTFSPGYEKNGVIYGGASRRLLRSSDRGQSWQGVDLRVTSFGRRVRDRLRRWGLPADWLGKDGFSQIYPTALIIPANDDTVLFATRFDGVMRYEHALRAFEPLWSGTAENVMSLEVSPNATAEQILYASVRGQGVIRSGDGGLTWMPVNKGLDFVNEWEKSPDGGNFRRDVIVAISPNFAADSTVFAGSPAGTGLFISRDRGDTWSMQTDAFDGVATSVLAIALSPDFTSDRTMIVSVKGQGVYRSVDAGRTFHAVGSELRTANASIEWLEFSAAFGTDRSMLAASDERLYLSENSGETWLPVTHPVRYEDMRDVVVFHGNHTRHENEAFSARTETIISGAGSGARLRFVGDRIRWIGSRGEDCGSANVYIDSEFAATVSCYADETTHMQTLFDSGSIGDGVHTFEIRIEAELNTGPVAVDGLDIVRAAR